MKKIVVNIAALFSFSVLLAEAAPRVLVEAKEDVVIDSRAQKEWRFPAVSDAHGRITVEFFHRIDYPRAAGFCRALQIEVNGKAINSSGTRSRSRLLNKPFEMRHKHHGKYVVDNRADKWYSMYLPDFHAADGFFSPATAEASRLLLDITDLTFTNQENKITIRCYVPGSLYVGNKAAGRRRAVVVGGFAVHAEPGVDHLSRKSEKEMRPKLAPLPKVCFSVGGGADELVLDTAGCKIPIFSKFSLPGGGEATMGRSKVLETKAYTVCRRIEIKSGRIDIFDTFRSKLNRLSGVRIRYEMPIGLFDPVYVAGDPSAGAEEFEGGRNPSVYAADVSRGFGVGLLAQDDVLRVQCKQYCKDGMFGIRTDSLALPPNGERTVEWSIYPTSNADYYEFINAVRRDWDVNFEINGGFTFGFAVYGGKDAETTVKRRINEGLVWQSMPAHFWRLVDSDPKYRNYVGNIWGMGRNSPQVRVSDAKGRIILEDPKIMDEFERKCIRRCRQINPMLKVFTYIHNQISVGIDDGKYEDSALYNAAGKRMYYGGKANNLFVPTLDNAFGQDFLKLVDWTCDNFDIDGIYQDECNHCNSRVYGGTNLWDGVTVELDEKNEVKRKYSYVPLLKLPLTLRTFDKIINERGKLMVANFSPETRSERRFKFPRFEETFSSRWIALAHLYTPIQLGDMLTYANTPRDMAADQRMALKRGALYYHYAGNTGCPSLTSKMFPFTPIELHSGWLVGKERILTCVSGEFGWRGERPEVDVYVFDELGREVPDFPVKVEDKPIGRVFTLELPQDHSAAIVKRP